MLTEKDAVPMLVNALLILIGTPIAILMMSNSNVMSPQFVITWVQTNETILNACIFLALQLVIGIFFFILNKSRETGN